MAQNGPSKFCGEGLMLRAERTWRGRYLRVTRVTPLTFYPEWMVQVAYQGAGAPQVRGGLGRAFARNYVRRNSLEYSGLRGEGSIPVPLPPPWMRSKQLNIKTITVFLESFPTSLPTSLQKIPARAAFRLSGFGSNFGEWPARATSA
jgi:hypothetical protein